MVDVHLPGKTHRPPGFECCVLQPCLGGDGKTLMFVNINCEPASVKETLCSLRFAAKVNQCETGAKGGARKHITELSSESSIKTAPAGTAEVHATAEHTMWVICASLGCWYSHLATVGCNVSPHQRNNSSLQSSS